jgi:ubiquitin-like-conjugating enzyme ATG10
MTDESVDPQPPLLHHKTATRKYLMEQIQFEAAIQKLTQIWSQTQDHDHSQLSDWQDLRLIKCQTQQGHFLRIARYSSTLGPPSRPTVQPSSEVEAADSDADAYSNAELPNEQDDAGEEEVEAEDDPESLVLPKLPPVNSPSLPVIIYDIVFSPTYCVPVLYLQAPPQTAQTQRPNLPPPEAFLTPLYHSAIRATGVNGGLSLVEHPETGRPVYFVHPCRTQEAVSEVLGGREGGVERWEWLMIWFGVVGSCVGLSVPLEVAKGLR